MSDRVEGSGTLFMPPGSSPESYPVEYSFRIIQRPRASGPPEIKLVGTVTLPRGVEVETAFTAACVCPTGRK